MGRRCPEHGSVLSPFPQVSVHLKGKEKTFPANTPSFRPVYLPVFWGQRLWVQLGSPPWLVPEDL